MIHNPQINTIRIKSHEFKNSFHSKKINRKQKNSPRCIKRRGLLKKHTMSFFISKQRISAHEFLQRF